MRSVNTAGADTDFAATFAAYGGRLDENVLASTDRIYGPFRLESGQIPFVPGRALLPTAAFYKYYRTRAISWLETIGRHPLTRAWAPPMHFGYIDNLELNALAATSGAFDFTGIYAGAVANLHFLFARLMSRPYCLPAFHGADENPAVIPPARYVGNEFVEPYERLNGPLSPERNVCVFTLVNDALDFTGMATAATGVRVASPRSPNEAR
jgi:hypothetical protein